MVVFVLQQISFAGGTPHFYSCLLYEPEHTGEIIAGLAGGITSLLVVITLIITIIVCCRQKRQSVKQSTSDRGVTDDRFTDPAEPEENESWGQNDPDVLKLESLRKPIFSDT